MYTIEMRTKSAMSAKKKEVLMQAVKEADAEAECRVDDHSCLISGVGTDLEQLSHFLGITMGCNSSSEVVKLHLSYEKQQ